MNVTGLRLKAFSTRVGHNLRSANPEFFDIYVLFLFILLT